jgi:hypothetical protein
MGRMGAPAGHPEAAVRADVCQEVLVQTATVNAVISLRRDAKPAGGWLSFYLPPLYTFSKNTVGGTRFELVASSVSGKLGPSWEVCHRRTESNGEPLICLNILRASG